MKTGSISTRQRKLLMLSPQLIVNLFSALAAQRTLIAVPKLTLPDDVHVLDVHHDYRFDAFAAVLISKEFDAVPDCCQAPEITDGSTESTFITVEPMDVQKKVEAAARGATCRGRYVASLSRLELVEALMQADGQQFKIETGVANA